MTIATTTTNGHVEVDYFKMADEAMITPEMLQAEQAEQAEADRSNDVAKILLFRGTSDEDNAQCLLALHPNEFAQNGAFGWLRNTGTHWAIKGAEEALDRAIVDTLQERIKAALASGKADKYGELIKRCIPNAGVKNSAKDLFSSLVYADEGAFDNDPDVLNCKNGVIDLQTGKLLKRSPDHRFMHCIETEYDPNADFSVWRNWLIEAVGSAEIADYLQIAVGYSLTGHTREEVLFYLYGPPRSGKGTLMETLTTLLGSPLSDTINFSVLTAKSEADTQNFNLAPLHNSRLVAASESNQYERFNEAKVKQVTGGDKIQCSFKHKTPFSYRPKYKLWLASNQPVNADPDDDAVWGRVRLIEFPHSHLGKENKALKSKMRSAKMLKGVLAWAVAGAVKWYALGDSGLPELPTSAEIKQSHRDELDNVGQWLDENIKPASDDKYVASSMLYTSYESWCKSNGVSPKKQKGFVQSLKRKFKASGKEYRDDRESIDGKQVRVVYGILFL